MSESGDGDCEKSDEKTDPGAIRHGNFMNYYQFHPAEERVRQLPRGVWQRQRVGHPARKYAGLDVGCNAGVRAAAAQLSGDVRASRNGMTPAFVIRNYKRPRLILVELSLIQLFARAPGIRFRNLCPLSLLEISCTRSFALPPASSFLFIEANTCFFLIIRNAWQLSCFLLAGDFLLARITRSGTPIKKTRRVTNSVTLFLIS